MEFAVCPTCHQSVLEDDAVVCPFCGASMKGKPSPKPTKPAPAAPSTAAAKPSTKSAGKTPGAGGADDLPFGLETGAAATAVAASRQPVKGRTLKVVCPMCETEGYVPPSAAGKEVRCANPKCLVPVFTAPAPEPEPVVAPPPKKSGNLVVLGLGTAGIVGALGGAAYFFSMPSGDVGSFSAPIDPASLRTPIPGNNTVAETPQPTTPAETPETPKVPATAAVDPQTLVTAALQDSQQVSLLTGNQNRSKPLCRRLAAEAFAISGDVAGARQQIEALQSVGGQIPFYQVTPWVEIFWQERQKGSTNEANEALDKALAAAERLPVRGREQLDIATRLAQALVVGGRIDAARTLIEAHQTSELDGEISAEFMWLAELPAVLDPAPLFSHRPLTVRQSPQAAVVAALAVLAGDRAHGLEYAQGWTTPAVQAECLTAWAEAVVWMTPAEAVAEIDQAIKSLSPASQSMVWARAARLAAARDNKPLALELIKKGTDLIATLAAPAAPTIPDMKSLVKTRPAFDSMWAAAAASTAELAVAHLEATDDQEGAANILNNALQYTRALGPTVPDISRLVDAANRAGPTALRNQIKAELQSRTDDEARQAMGLYRRSLSDLETAAQTRLQLQKQILTRATEQGLEAGVWTIVSQTSAVEDPALKEPFLESDVPMWLLERFRQSGKTSEEQTLLAMLSTAGLKTPGRPPSAVVDESLASGKFQEAWKMATSPEVRSDLRDALLLKGVTRQALSSDPLSKTWELISAIKDITLREQAVDLAAWMASRRGAASEVWNHRKNLSSATEIVSLERGMIAGIAEHRASHAPAAAATTESTTEVTPAGTAREQGTFATVK